MLFYRALLRVVSIVDQNIHCHKFTTYKTLGAELNYAPRHPHIANSLGTILREDHELGNPHRSATVVRSDTGAPGQGYFWVCRELGLLKNLDDHLELLNLWKIQLDKLGFEMPEQVELNLPKNLETTYQDWQSLLSKKQSQ